MQRPSKEWLNLLPTVSTEDKLPPRGSGLFGQKKGTLVWRQ